MSKVRTLNAKTIRKPHFFRGVPENKRISESVIAATAVPKGVNARYYRGIGDVLIDCNHPDAESFKSQDGLAPLATISGNVLSHEDETCKSCRDIGKGCYEYLP